MLERKLVSVRSPTAIYGKLTQIRNDYPQLYDASEKAWKAEMVEQWVLDRLSDKPGDFELIKLTIEDRKIVGGYQPVSSIRCIGCETIE
ncbi:hypothetical protein GP486_000402 [Trichoglossum hirsutum]|uniref:Uncharacterized protein n=1 Tax=Trichoglossum hirsutum TaxID=265104 RepID=A0A9P8LIT1_9PEZI|nr:hypothetical protein GP486_000402 [Trichoglossum hirsutum]